MPTLLLTNHYEGTPLQILTEVVGEDFDLIVLDSLSADELKAKIATADYLLVSGRMKVSAEVLSCARQLRMVQRTGVGLDNMDLDYMRAQGIPLYVNRGVNATSVAEHAVYLILATLRRSYYVNKRIRAGIWAKQQTGLTTHELCGKTVGVVGTGSIGMRVCRMLSAFDVRLVYTSVPRLDEAVERELGLEYRALPELLGEADVVTLHCPAQPDGPLLTRELIEGMKPGAILVNTARGSLVDMEALVDALEGGRLGGAGIDVFDAEPISPEARILQCDDAVLSPHVAGVTYEAFRSMMSGAVANIRAFDRGDLESIADKRLV